MKRVRITVTALGLALGLAVPAAPAASADEPVGSYTLDIKSLINFQITEVTLTCEPTGGNHPDADAACADLAAANGDISAIPSLPGSCGWNSPVAINAFGTWAGQSEAYGGGRFDNLCDANLATGGHVFNF